MKKEPRILVTICARGGSKGLPGKNIRPFLGTPLIGVTIQQAKRWGKASRIVVSTDSEEIARVARKYGGEAPFLRPAALATDTAGKLPVLSHCLRESEKAFAENYDVVLDLDVTSPVRTPADLEKGWKTFLELKPSVCLSVVPARKNPYFNMLERDGDGKIVISKPLRQVALSRQAAPPVWEANASIYFYDAQFLRTAPSSVWDGRVEIFEMPKTSAFDIDEEIDFLVAEMMMKKAISDGEEIL